MFKNQNTIGNIAKQATNVCLDAGSLEAGIGRDSSSNINQAIDIIDNQITNIYDSIAHLADKISPITIGTVGLSPESERAETVEKNISPVADKLYFIGAQLAHIHRSIEAIKERVDLP